MELEDIIATAVREGADMVRVVEDASIRVYFRIDGYLTFRYHAFVANPPGWHATLTASDGERSLEIPAALVTSVAELPLTLKTVHDARIVEIGIVLTEAERIERKHRDTEEAARQAIERQAFAEEMAFRDAESKRAPDPAKIARLDDVLLSSHRLLIPLQVGEDGTGAGQLGGFPAWPVDRPWPVTGDGTPMTFLAQIDCARFAAVPGMPTGGLLQFFYHPEGAYGTDAEDGLAVIWHEDAGFARILPDAMPPGDPERDGALSDPDRARTLVALAACPGYRNIDESFLAENPEFDRHYGPERELLWDRIPERATEHFVGGWPDPCQDFPYDRDTVVLLRLGSADGMMWSDGGDFHVLIAQADLDARAFEKAWSAFETH